jgi:hypothetical protein
MVDKAASELARKRWSKAGKKERAAAAKKMLDAKSPEQLSEIGRKAVTARWKKAKAKKAK